MPIIIDAPLEIPVQESVQIRNGGSYTLPLAARKAHRLNLTVEIISVTRNQYTNLMYNPPQGEYCNVTYWVGDAVKETRKVKYPKEVLIEWLNLEKSIVAQAASDVLVTATNMRTIALAQGVILGETPFTRPFVWAYPVTHLKFIGYPDTQMKVTCTWWDFEYPPFEFAEPDPNTADPPGGNDEYKKPKRNPNDEPWEGNAPASPPDPSRDPRDYDDANEPPPPESPGPDCTKQYLVTFSGTYTEEGGPGGSFSGQQILPGEIVGFESFYNPAFRSWAYRAIIRSCAGDISYANMYGTTGVTSLTGSATAVET